MIYKFRKFKLVFTLNPPKMASLWSWPQGNIALGSISWTNFWHLQCFLLWHFKLFLLKTWRLLAFKIYLLNRPLESNSQKLNVYFIFCLVIVIFQILPHATSVHFFRDVNVHFRWDWNFNDVTISHRDFYCCRGVP